MIITFKPLNESHFSLLLRWLEMPHVKKWWLPEKDWTIDTIYEKYYSYVRGVRMEYGELKKIIAYIIYINTTPIGYIQYYNVFDFKLFYKNYCDLDISFLPKYCAGVDLYIGEIDFINAGYGAKILLAFMKNYIQQEFKYIFITPNKANLAAIHVYEKVGFKRLLNPENVKFTLMLNDMR